MWMSKVVSTLSDDQNSSGKPCGKLDLVSLGDDTRVIVPMLGKSVSLSAGSTESLLSMSSKRGITVASTTSRSSNSDSCSNKLGSLSVTAPCVSDRYSARVST